MASSKQGSEVAPTTRLSCCQKFALTCAACYSFIKLIALPCRLIYDLGKLTPEWHAFVSNQTFEDCARCFQFGVRGQVPEGTMIELTDCYKMFGHMIVVEKPKGAESGNSTESWKASWEDLGDDWWSRWPLEESPTRFDERWLLPNWNHQTVIRVDTWWPDYLVLVCFLIAAVFVPALMWRGAAAVSALGITAAMVGAFTPYFSYRLAQSFNWHIVDRCAHADFETQQFISLVFWMKVFFYGSIVAFGLVAISKKCEDCRPQGDSRWDNEAEVTTAKCVEAVVASTAWILGLVFLSEAVEDRPEHDILRRWLTALVIFPLDFFILGSLVCCVQTCMMAEERIIDYSA